MLTLLLVTAAAALLLTAGCGSGTPAEPVPDSNILSMRADTPGRERPQKPENLPQRVPEEVRLREVIAQYEATLDEDLDSEESKAAMLALANLYRQKMLDYSRAMFWYEQYIDRYPEESNIAWVFGQAISCLEELNAPIELRLLYRKMMEVFPEGTEQHEFARQRLYEGVEESAASNPAFAGETPEAEAAD